MDSEKERIAKWRVAKQRRRNEQKVQAAKQTYRTLFAIDDNELTDPPELQEYLVRQNLAKGNRPTDEQR